MFWLMLHDTFTDGRFKCVDGELKKKFIKNWARREEYIWGGERKVRKKTFSIIIFINED